MSASNTQGLCVPYVVLTTPDKGRGLYADAFIAEGTTVWRHVAGQYAVYDEQSFKALLAYLPDSEAAYVLTHAHCMHEFPGYMIWVFDDGELINHSDQPTLRAHTKPGFDGVTAVSCAEDISTAILGDYFTLVSTRDIEKGEELTTDYSDDAEDPPYYDPLCEQYRVSWDWM